MGGRLWVLNVLILLALLMASYHAYRIWENKSAEYALTFPRSDHSKAISESLPEMSAPRPREDYQGIVDGNLFSPMRSPENPPAPETPVDTVVADKPDAQDRYVLYGTISINRENYYALIRDKKSTESKTRSFKVGDKLPGNELVTDINKRKVVISSQFGKTELRLRAPKGPEDTSFVPTPVPTRTIKAQQQTIRRTPVPTAARTSARVIRPRRQTTQSSQIENMPEGDQSDYSGEDSELYQEQEEEQEEYPPGYENNPADGGQP